MVFAQGIRVDIYSGVFIYVAYDFYRLQKSVKTTFAVILLDGRNYRLYVGIFFSIVLVSPLLYTEFSGSFLEANLAEFGVKPINLTELFLIHTSFIENYSMGADHCINLPPNARVSPFDTREPTPNRVLMAQPINSGPDRSGRSYTYRVVPCSKPTDPERGP